MKYISIDIETTGLDPETCQILSIGAVIEDTNNLLPFNDLPKFYGIIKQENLAGSVFALNLNKDLIETLNSYMNSATQDEKNDIVNETGANFYNKNEIVEALFHFCHRNDILPNYKNTANITSDHIVVNGIAYPKLTKNLPKTYLNCAGKNFAGFDRKFLELLPRWKQIFYIRSRVLDPGILFVDWKNDEAVPGLFECKQRAAIDGIVTHNALEDAMDVVMLLRNTYQK
jgi:DNA polymerase III epsilon subunit-like protein